MKETVTASESVFGFAAWLAGRTEPVTLSSKHDAAVAAELAGEWCKVNNLPEPRSGVYPKNITIPD